MAPHRQRAFCGGGTLRIGAFGAIRPLKNLMSSAGAALEISRRLRVPLGALDSGGRAEGGGETVLAAVKQMIAGLPNVDTEAQRLAILAELSQNGRAYALAAATELHRIVQYGDGGRHGGRRGFGCFGSH